MQPFNLKFSVTVTHPLKIGDMRHTVYAIAELLVLYVCV